jgi:replicative DNA helicase
MSIGLQLLRSLIENGSRTEFRQLSEVLFVAEEIPAYEFVTAFYRRHGQLPTVGACQENRIMLPTAPNPPGYYMDRLRNRAVFNVIAAQQRELAPAMQGRNMEDAVRIIQEMSYAVGRFETQRDVITLAEAAEGVLEEYRHAHANPGRQGVTLGWNYLDEITNGAEPGDIVTFVARPGMGKSWLMTHCAHQAWHSGASVLFVTMEMTAQQITRRFLGLDAGINPNYLRRGQLSRHAESAIYERAESFQSGAPFHLVSGSFEKSVPMVDAAVQEFAPDVVFIDASYLMSPSGPRGKSAQWELLTRVGTEIKAMAMARQKPIVQSVQFNREAKKTRNVGVEHVGGSDVVGQISSIAIGVQEGDSPNERTTRKLTVMKNREGDSSGDFQVRFLFDPPNFAHIPTDDQEGQRQEHTIEPGSEWDI